jgi:TrmH family RNA methyltransferase
VLVADALATGTNLDAVFAAPAADPALLAAAEARGVLVHRVADDVLERVLTTTTPPAIVAVAPWCDVPLESVLGADFLVVLVDVADPGNAGTIVRSAEAAGAGAVIFPSGAVDPFNPKCVRASAGSIFHLPVVSGGEAVGGLERIGADGRRRVAAVAHGGRLYDEVDLTGPVAIVLGNEAHGLPAAAASQIDELVGIPMAGAVESLNVAMAGSVLCFEVARQRRGAARST